MTCCMFRIERLNQSPRTFELARSVACPWSSKHIIEFTAKIFQSAFSTRPTHLLTNDEQQLKQVVRGCTKQVCENRKIYWDSEVCAETSRSTLRSLPPSHPGVDVVVGFVHFDWSLSHNIAILWTYPEWPCLCLSSRYASWVVHSALECFYVSCTTVVGSLFVCYMKKLAHRSRQHFSTGDCGDIPALTTSSVKGSLTIDIQWGTEQDWQSWALWNRLLIKLFITLWIRQ